MSTHLYSVKTVRVIGALALVAGITVFYDRIVRVNNVTVALSFLLLVLAIATRWGLIEALIASVASMLCFNFFFLPPIRTFTIADPQNWVALSAFVVTSAIASHLSASAKRRALESLHRQQEMEKLYTLSRNLLLLEVHGSLAQETAN